MIQMFEGSSSVSLSTGPSFQGNQWGIELGVPLAIREVIFFEITVSMSFESLFSQFHSFNFTLSL